MIGEPRRGLQGPHQSGQLSGVDHLCAEGVLEQPRNQGESDLVAKLDVPSLAKLPLPRWISDIIDRLDPPAPAIQEEVAVQQQGETPLPGRKIDLDFGFVGCRQKDSPLNPKI